MSTYPLSIWLFILVMFVINISDLFENILMEYVLVKLTKLKNEEKTQEAPNNELPFFFGFRALGNVIGSFFGGRIIEAYGNQFSFKVALFAPVVLFVCLFVFDEEGVDPNTKPRKNIKQDWALIKLLFKKYSEFILICLGFILKNMDLE